MWTDIRITVQYNRVQLFFHHRYYWNIYIYTYDTCCSKSLYQVVSVVLLDLLLNLAQSAKVNPTCQKKKNKSQLDSVSSLTFMKGCYCTIQESLRKALL